MPRAIIGVIIIGCIDKIRAAEKTVMIFEDEMTLMALKIFQIQTPARTVN